jgi:hypothetical protein
MSDFGLLIGASLGTGAGVVAGGYLGYRILKKKKPLLKTKMAGVKHAFIEGFTDAYSHRAEKQTTEKVSRPKRSCCRKLTKAFSEGFDKAYYGPQEQTVALA